MKNIEQHKNASYRLAETLHLLLLINNYIDTNLMNLHNLEENNSKANFLFDSLIRLKRLGNISDTLSIVINSIEESVNFFLDEVEEV